jgi:hypothetical protein
METRWIKNRLAVSGPQAPLRKFVDQAEGVYPRRKEAPRESVLCFNSLVQLPPSATFLDELAEWGCKWGSYNAERRATHNSRDKTGVVEFSFDTPWAPPFEAFHRIARMFSTLAFHLEYSAEDREFEGRAEWSNGTLTLDQCRGANAAPNR